MFLQNRCAKRQFCRIMLSREKMKEQTTTLWQQKDCKQCFAPRSGECNKGDFGYVALIAGSIRYGGAAKLANLAAATMRSGAGVVKLAVPNCLSQAVLPYLLESTLFPLSEQNGELRFERNELSDLTHNVKTVAFGMGCGTGDGVKQILKFLLSEYDGTLILDADGLNCLAQTSVAMLKNCKPRVVLTPHVKEFSRLSGVSVQEIQSHKAELAKQFAREYGVTLLLKGSVTVVTDGAKTYLVQRGCAGMATAGSGDVLSGVLAAIAAFNGERLTEAATTAAFVNGVAGELAEKEVNSVSMVAFDTVRHIPEAITEILRS